MYKQIQKKFDALEFDDASYNEVLEDEDGAGDMQVETENAVVEDIPVDLKERFNYLIQMKYNRAFLDGLSVSQVNEE